MPEILQTQYIGQFLHILGKQSFYISSGFESRSVDAAIPPYHSFSCLLQCFERKESVLPT